MADIFEFQHRAGTKAQLATITLLQAEPGLVTDSEQFVFGDGTNHQFAQLYRAATELTIATDAITITQGYHTIDTESNAASDDLATINGGSEGRFVLVRAENAARTVVLKDGTGNLELGGADITLDDTDQSILLYYDTALSKWLLVGISLSGVGDVLADGSVPLTANWDAGAFEVRALTFESDVTTGTAPFTIASTTVVSNLNADLLDGEHAAAFADASHTHSLSDVTDSGALAALDEVQDGQIDSEAATDGYVLTADGAGGSAWEVVAGGGDLKADGTVPLTATWDVGAFQIHALTFQSDQATGTAPFTVASTTVVTNLNADTVDAIHASTILQAGGGVALSANWDAGGYEIRSLKFQSDQATGTAPLIVASTTVVANLNASLLEGNAAAAFAVADHDGTHVTGGSDEIDGDKLDIDYNPSYSTPATTPGEADSIDNLAAHLYGIDQAIKALTKCVVQVKIMEDDTALTAGDGKFQYIVDQKLNGYNLVRAHMHVFTASSSGLPTFQVHNLTQMADMLSTLITIDENEYDSEDAATPPVIDEANDDVATGDVIRIDCDIAGTGTKGLEMRLQFQKP